MEEIKAGERAESVAELPAWAQLGQCFSPRTFTRPLVLLADCHPRTVCQQALRRSKDSSGFRGGRTRKDKAT